MQNPISIFFISNALAFTVSSCPPPVSDPYPFVEIKHINFANPISILLGLLLAALLFFFVNRFLKFKSLEKWGAISSWIAVVLVTAIITGACLETLKRRNAPLPHVISESSIQFPEIKESDVSRVKLTSRQAFEIMMASGGARYIALHPESRIKRIFLQDFPPGQPLTWQFNIYTGMPNVGTTIIRIDANTGRLVNHETSRGCA